MPRKSAGNSGPPRKPQPRLTPYASALATRRTSRIFVDSVAASAGTLDWPENRTSCEFAPSQSGVSSLGLPFSVRLSRESQRYGVSVVRIGGKQQVDTSADPSPTKLSARDYVAILKRSVKEIGADNLTNIAAALAYYAFLAIPSVLMVAVGVFSLIGNPDDAAKLVDRLGGIVPEQGRQLLRDSLTTLTNNKGTGLSVLVLGSLLALWSLTGAMQNLMWGLNVAYDREESRGFVRRRLTALTMVGFTALGVLRSPASTSSARTSSIRAGSSSPSARSSGSSSGWRSPDCSRSTRAGSARTTRPGARSRRW
jgi:hypothetical protein